MKQQIYEEALKRIEEIARKRRLERKGINDADSNSLDEIEKIAREARRK